MIISSFFMLVYEIFAFLTKSIKSIVGIYRPVSKVLRALDNFFFNEISLHSANTQRNIKQFKILLIFKISTFSKIVGNFKKSQENVFFISFRTIIQRKYFYFYFKSKPLNVIIFFIENSARNYIILNNEVFLKQIKNLISFQKKKLIMN